MIGRFLTRYYLLNKRLFKKYSFLLILCMVPLLVGGLRLAAKEESGIARVVLCLPDPEDEMAVLVAEELMCEEEEEARRMVMEDEADTAWIFHTDLRESLQAAASKKRVRPVVKVVERKDSVSLILSREILGAALYPAFSYAVYEDYIRKNLRLTEISGEQIRQAYERTLVEGSLFQMAYLDGGQEEEEAFHYLQAPVRGMLAIWLVLCGLAACLYFMQDEEQGLYARTPVARRLSVSFGVCAVFVSDAALILLLACKAAGVFTVWHREVWSCALFACATLAFCTLIRLLCAGLSGGQIFTAALLLSVVCP